MEALAIGIDLIVIVVCILDMIDANEKTGWIVAILGWFVVLINNLPI